MEQEKKVKLNITLNVTYEDIVHHNRAEEYSFKLKTHEVSKCKFEWYQIVKGNFWEKWWKTV